METLQGLVEKKCSKCTLSKGIDSFYLDNRAKDKLARKCKDCSKQDVAEWAKTHQPQIRDNYKRWSKKNPEALRFHRNKWSKENREKMSESRRAWSEKNKEKIKNKNLIYNFGITLSDYEELLKQQNGVCALCFHVSTDGRQLCVDHCHDTLRVRGLLCTKCNTGIGLLKEDVELLQRAIKYIAS